MIVLFSVCLVGYSPYITNIIDDGNPLYPLYGKGSVDIMTNNQPKSFAEMNSIEKLTISLFSKVDNININVDREPELKIPFTVTAEEIQQCSVDTRISGYGPWFSGILLITRFVLFIKFIVSLKEKKLQNVYFVGFMFLCVILMLFFTGNWWARYSLYQYFLVVGVFLVFDYSKKSKVRDIFLMSFAVIILINTMFFNVGNYNAYVATKNIQNTLINLSNVSADERYVVEINLVAPDMSGAQYNLKDYNVKYTIPDEEFSSDGIYAGYTYRIIEKSN